MHLKDETQFVFERQGACVNTVPERSVTSIDKARHTADLMVFFHSRKNSSSFLAWY